MSVLSLVLACAGDPPDTFEPTNTTEVPEVWEVVGPTGACEVRVSGPPRLPPPTPEDCQPAPPGWQSGPVAGRALATIHGRYIGDQLGYDLEAVDPDGDGRDGLVVGVPRFDVPPTGSGGSGTTYRQAATDLLTGSRVYVLSELAGEVALDDSLVVLNEPGGVPSVGQSVGVLRPDGPVLAGDYWRNPAGAVFAIDVHALPYTTTTVEGLANEQCGADVGSADIDADGHPDLVTSCLARSYDTSLLRVFEGASGTLQPLGSIPGNGPYDWFGRPTQTGFDLDHDGVADLAIGEEHTPYNVDGSLVHVLTTPWRGECSLGDLGAGVLGNGFPPANLAAGDVDGDGVGELVITRQGMPAWSLVPQPLDGWVHVLREPPRGTALTGDAAWLTLQGTDPDEGFGSAVAVGDFNGDGCSDIAVGAEGFELSALSDPGRVYVFDGPFEPGTVSAADADVVLDGTSSRDWFGRKLVVGDYNGDGIDDLAITALYDSSVAPENGAVYVLAGARAQ